MNSASSSTCRGVCLTPAFSKKNVCVPAADTFTWKLPDDPFTLSATTWQTVPAEPDPNNPSAEVGVYDVKSGSEATALDGTKYSDWD